jgi:prepilin-type N-terminal cleavage/methylation domain-containing protein
MKQDQKGFTLVETLLVLILITLVSFVGWYVWHSNKNTSAASQVNQQKQAISTVSESKTYSNSELAFTFKYPSSWSTLDTTTDYGFYSVRLRAPGTVVESCQGECIKAGAQILLVRNKVSNKSYSGQLVLMDSIAKFKSANAQYLSNEKDIDINGVDVLEYDGNQASIGGTNLHGVQFYKNDVDYSFTLDSSKYSDPQYGKVFDGIISSIKFN